ncbi:hypothetical protein [Falsiroseomonas sp. HW251]|uniref:hypothetical protein n=1 Tax=Falsiroseomonas sp. HW251 TaxID=3390998 RepID=UPI003D3169C3
MGTDDTPLVLRHRSGSEWMRHIAGQALRCRAARTKREEAWREAEPFLPCG